MGTPLPPTDLPVEEIVGALQEAVAGAGAAVLHAPPGAGKTTVVPLRLLAGDWLEGRRIVVLEPRRLAARAAAIRMAATLGEPVGATVGYRTRDERKVGPATRIEVVTEGILTRRLQADPSLPGVGLVVFDEVHERNLHTDLALALALDARRGLRPDLRLLAMSATADTARLAALLGDAPVVTSDGRQYPVDVRWSPPPPRQRVSEAMAAAVLRALRAHDGDVLAFLAGAGDIRRTQSLLGDAVGPGVDIRPLFGALSPAEQDLALQASPPGRRRVVLATDIAETSLTVAGVTVVVDSGEARTPRFHPASGLTRLHTGPISRASADQRAGRAGRLGPGVAYRLWSKLEHAARRPFPVPEIASVDLAGLALELAVWGATADELPWLDPPPAAALAEGVALLTVLGAVGDTGRPTATGRAMAGLPVHPRLARMVVDGAARRWGPTACALAALLEDRDVLRGHPDEVPVDLADRVRLLADRSARHPQADRVALSSARRQAGELARRAGVPEGRAAPGLCGPVLALAYPDRVAKARGGARFRLRNGGGAWVPQTDPMAREAFLVAADLDRDRRDSRIRLAAAIDEAEVLAVAGDAVTTHTTVAWDDRRDDVRATTTRRLDNLELGVADGPAPAGVATTEALADRVRATRLAALPWTAAARSLQARVAFLRAADGETWPDLSDRGLLATIDEWLVPHLAGATGKAGLDRLALVDLLRGRLDWAQQRALDQRAPTRLALPRGRAVAISYEDGRPVAASRVQDFFGMKVHPTVAGVPVLLQLLSPARRPVQVTADLPGFWAGSYAEVRKEMAGRYPKHAWPLHPAE